MPMTTSLNWWMRKINLFVTGVYLCISFFRITLRYIYMRLAHLIYKNPCKISYLALSGRIKCDFIAIRSFYPEAKSDLCKEQSIPASIERTLQVFFHLLLLPFCFLTCGFWCAETRPLCQANRWDYHRTVRHIPRQNPWDPAVRE